MTLVKMTPTPVKTCTVAKAKISSPTAKSPSSPSMKKPTDVTSPLKKPLGPSSPIKGKSASVPMKPATKTEPSAVKVEKSPTKIEKSPPKLTVTKTNNTTIKSSPAVNKSPVPKSPAAETRTSIRNVIKPIITSKMPEQKQLDSKKESSTVRSLSVSKTPSKSSSVVKNTISPAKSVSSPVKSISTPIKSVSSPTTLIYSSVKSISSSAKSVSSPIKSIPSSTKTISSPIKSISSKSVSSPVKSISSSTKSVSSPVKSISSLTKSVSSPIKSILSPAKSISSPSKSISSFAKSISSPIKPKLTREVNLGSPGKTKDPKASQLSLNSLAKKPLSVPKSPIKPTQSSTSKLDVTGKLKPSEKNSPTSKVEKSDSILTKTTVKTQPTDNATDEMSNISPCAVAVAEEDLCHCDDSTKKDQESSNDTGLITEYTIDNTSNFNVVQAFKVAEQLIKIQSNDRSLETIIETCENNSVINWDDVITPCDDFVVSNPNSKIESTSLELNDIAVLCFNPVESASKYESCTVETTNSNCTAVCPVSDTQLNEQNDNLFNSTNSDENNNNIIELAEVFDPSSIPGQFPETQKYFTIELPTQTTNDDSIRNHYDENESTEIESNDEENSTKELSFDCADDSIENHCHEDVLPEWTITIDEFSLDLSPKEIQSSEVSEKENCSVEETPCIVGLSYADILKKSPKVLANSTNLEFSKKEPQLQIKSYQTLKKSKISRSKDSLFDDIENNYQNCEDLYEEPECCEMRKKKHKKIKHLPKKHLRNINRESEYFENHNDIFVTHVWRDIY